MVYFDHFGDHSQERGGGARHGVSLVVSKAAKDPRGIAVEIIHHGNVLERYHLPTLIFQAGRPC